MSELKGAKEMEKVLRGLPRQLGVDVLQRSLRAGANVIKKEAINRAPMRAQTPLNHDEYIKQKKKYGHLKKNIKVSRVKHRGGAAVMRVHTGKAFWGMFIEFGTRYITARPFLSVAFESSYSEALKRIGERLGKNIESAAKKLAGPRAKQSKAFRRKI